MKAKIVHKTLWSFCFSTIIEYLVVEELGCLAIHIIPYNNQVNAFTGFKFNDNCKVIGEIEISDELVERALSLVHIRAELNNFREFLKKLFV